MTGVKKSTTFVQPVSDIDKQAASIDKSIRLVERVSSMPDTELRDLQSMVQQEQSLRRHAAEEKAKKGRYKRLKYLFKHRDTFLKVMDHNSSECSDENPMNDDANDPCSKCILIKMEEWQVESSDFQITLTLKELER